VGPASANYRLILAEVSDTAKEEHMKVFMPQDNLNLEFDLRMILAIPAEEQRIENIFSRLTPEETGKAAVLRIDFDKVYDTYGKNPVREVARAVVAKYSIAQVLQSREAVSAEIQAAVTKALKDSPLVVLNAGLADVQPPQVIVAAQEAAKEREIAITKAEAQRAVEMTEADTKLQVAKKQQEIDLVEAETQARVNEVLAKGVTPAFVTQRMIRVMEQMASSPNKVFFIPEAALQNPAMMMGVMHHALNPADQSTTTTPAQPGRKDGK
jgi:F0F1-type ATP synthase epsilon subunit